MPRFREFTIKASAESAARSGVPAIYHVTQENGKSLFITTNELSGWVPLDQVVLLEQAPAFFTGQIRANPRDSFAYAMCAIALLAVKSDFQERDGRFQRSGAIEPGRRICARQPRRRLAGPARCCPIPWQISNEAIRPEPKNPAYLIDLPPPGRAASRL